MKVNRIFILFSALQLIFFKTLTTSAKIENLSIAQNPELRPRPTLTINGNNTEARWKRAGKKEELGFYIERSTDGEHYDAITWIIAKDGTDDFFYVDYDLPPQKYYYRIKSIDRDGITALSYASEVTITNALPEKPTTTRIYLPRPIVALKQEENTRILSITNINPEKCKTIELYNSKEGRKMNIRLMKDENKITVPLNTITRGQYILLVYYGESRLEERFDIND
jgi:hypothetical protein